MGDRGFDTLPWLLTIPGGGWLAVDARIKLTNSDDEEPDRTPDEHGRWSNRQVYNTPKTTVKTDDDAGLACQFVDDADQPAAALRTATTPDLPPSWRSSVVRDIGPAKLELGAS